MSLSAAGSGPLSPSTLRKSSSCDNVTRRTKAHSMSHVASPQRVMLLPPNSLSHVASPQRESTSVYTLMQNSLLADVKKILPNLIKASVKEELQPMLLKRDELKHEISELQKKVDGYKTQVEKYVELVKTMDNITLPEVVKDLSALETAWNSKEKSITLKTKDLLSTQNKIQNDMQEISKLHEEWEKLLKAKTNGCVIKDIEQSQQFVSEEYEEFRDKQEKLASTVASLEQKVAKQEVKSEHNANYPRWDSVEIEGIPTVPVDAYGNENCKEMVINICKELHYWLPPSAISTAHRLKKHQNKRGPPGMIVKFNNRDIRNDVYSLRKQIKDKQFWKCYNIGKLFINESLTPDPRKLFYKTRSWAKEMQPTHGRIFTWTYKGEIFIRKNAENAPKRKILSEQYLSKLSNGDISLDISDKPVVPESIVVIEDIMAAPSLSAASD